MWGRAPVWESSGEGCQLGQELGEAAGGARGRKKFKGEWVVRSPVCLAGA